jgi:hypothetical protein
VKKKQSSRPKLPSVSDEMKAWATALGSEVVAWPHVGTRSFFGFTAFYRKDRIFVLLPRTRGMETANSLAFKLDVPTEAARARLDKDPHITSTHVGETRWFTFALSADSDLYGALDWLGTAYEAAGKKKASS